jgi:hypothetical protein
MLKPQHRNELFSNERIWFGMRLLRCPQGDSNPCLGLERAPSWATRRWGRLASLTRVSDVVCGGVKRPNQAGEIVSFQSSIVNKRTRSPVDEKDVYFTRSVHADGERHFDIRRA